MLDCNDPRTELIRWILSLPCNVLPPEEFAKTSAGVQRTPTMPGDGRRHGRLLCRGENLRAALEYRRSLPALVREAGWLAVYTSDVSRSGCGFLHSEPLYPGEQLGLVLVNGSRHLIEIAWCRRLGPRCFAIGSRFVESTETKA